MEVVLKGYFDKNKEKRESKGKQPKNNQYTSLGLLDYQSPELIPPLVFDENKQVATADDYMDLSQDYLTIARNYDSLSILLDVVDVTAKRISPAEEERKERSFMYGGNPDSRVILDSMQGMYPISVFDILRRMPGVRVSGDLWNETVSMRGGTSASGSNTPIFFLDGISVDIETVRGYDVNDIEFVDVIRGARAGIMGNGGGNGAIMIYTRTGSTETQRRNVTPGVLKTKIYGFYKARQFATFNPTAPGNKGRPDIRTTLHWNAALSVGESGSVNETFFTSDQKGKFVVIGQGLRKDGRPFFGMADFVVE